MRPPVAYRQYCQRVVPSNTSVRFFRSMIRDARPCPRVSSSDSLFPGSASSPKPARNRFSPRSSSSDVAMVMMPSVRFSCMMSARSCASFFCHLREEPPSCVPRSSKTSTVPGGKREVSSPMNLSTVKHTWSSVKWGSSSRARLIATVDLPAPRFCAMKMSHDSFRSTTSFRICANKLRVFLMPKSDAKVGL